MSIKANNLLVLQLKAITMLASGFSLFVVLIFTISTNVDGNCKAALKAAKKRYEQAIEETGRPMVGIHYPTCLEDGTYHPVQCQEAMCRCVAADGTEILPFIERYRFPNMNCECVRKQYEYQQTGMLGAKFNCDERTGNYKHIQCVGSQCYCSDSRGKQVGETFPIHEL